MTNKIMPGQLWKRVRMTRNPCREIDMSGKPVNVEKVEHLLILELSPIHDIKVLLDTGVITYLNGMWILDFYELVSETGNRSE